MKSIKLKIKIDGESYKQFRELKKMLRIRGEDVDVISYSLSICRFINQKTCWDYKQLLINNGELIKVKKYRGKVKVKVIENE